MSIKNGEIGHQTISTEQGQWATIIAEGSDASTSFSDQCGNIIGTAPLISVDGEKNQLVEVDENIELFQLVTEMITCDGEVVENPSILINSSADDQVFYFSNSEVNNLLAICGNIEFNIAGFNIESGVIGPGLQWSNQQGGLDYLSACEEGVNGYSYIDIEGETRYYPAFQLGIEEERTILESADGTIKIGFEGMKADLYSADMLSLFLEDPGFGEKGYTASCVNSGCGIDQFNVTHYDLAGGWLRVVFSGEVYMRTIVDREAGSYQMEGVIIIKT